MKADARVVPTGDPPVDARSSAEGARTWLGWLALSLVIGMQAGTIFKPLGEVGETRVADWVDLVTPYAVVGTATVVMWRAGADRVAWAVFTLGGVTFVLGHGLHLSANSISNVADKHVAHASIVHLWDEVASHYIWYSGLFVMFVALVLGLRAVPLIWRPLDHLVAVLVAVTLVNIHIEGDVAWLGLAFFAIGLAAGVRGSAPVARLPLLIGVLGLVLLVGWGVYWYAADGTVFPEFSDVGWI